MGYSLIKQRSNVVFTFIYNQILSHDGNKNLENIKTMKKEFSTT